MNAPAGRGFGSGPRRIGALWRRQGRGRHLRQGTDAERRHADWLRDTRDVRFDRGMLGDGVIDNRRLPAAVDATGYNGAVEVKIFSVRDWRQRDPDEFVPTIKTRFSQDL